MDKGLIKYTNPKVLSISKKTKGNKNGLKVKLVNEQLSDEILDGLMLSDGHITKPETTNCNSLFSMSQATKYKEFVDVIIKHLENLGYSTTSFICKRKNTTHYNILTKRYTDFQKLRKRWYPNGKKIVPNDLILTPKILAFWFQGDGSSRYTYKNYISEIFLLTMSFTLIENRFLVKILKRDLDITGFHIYRQKNMYFLTLKQKAQVQKFLSIIEPFITKCFKYKIKYPFISNNKKRICQYEIDISRTRCVRGDCDKTAIKGRAVCNLHKGFMPKIPERKHFKKSKIRLHVINCACGCGELLIDRNMKSDKVRFIQGHYANLLRNLVISLA